VLCLFDFMSNSNGFKLLLLGFCLEGDMGYLYMKICVFLDVIMS